MITLSIGNQDSSISVSQTLTLKNYVKEFPRAGGDNAVKYGRLLQIMDIR
jgi:hypothetical protein